MITSHQKHQHSGPRVPAFTWIAFGFLTLSNTLIHGDEMALPDNARAVDIRHTLLGETDCVESAKRYYFYWHDYDRQLKELKRKLNKGPTSLRRDPDSFDMMELATRKRLARFRKRQHSEAYDDRVDGEENSVFGADPDKDIASMTQFNWTQNAQGSLGHKLRVAPRVQSVTIIKLKEDYKADLQVVNSISLRAAASISANQDLGKGKRSQHNVVQNLSLKAIDIDGREHSFGRTINSALYRKRKGTWIIDDSQTSELPWGRGVYRSSPSNDIGFRRDYLQIFSTDPEPSIDRQVYRASYEYSLKKKYKLDCGESLSLSRTAETKVYVATNMWSEGTVSVEGNLFAGNELVIRVDCKECADGGGDNEGEEGGDEEGKGGENPGGDGSGGGNKRPFVKPTVKKPVYYAPTVPVPDEKSDQDPPQPPMPPGFWGRLWMPGETFPDFVLPLPLPPNGQPDLPQLPLPNGMVPFFHVEGESLDGFLPLGFVPSGVRFIGVNGTSILVYPADNRIEFHGPFVIVDPESGQQQQQFQGPAEIRFAQGGQFALESPFEVVAYPIDELVQFEENGVNIYESIDTGLGQPNGILVQEQNILRFPSIDDLPASPLEKEDINTPDDLVGITGTRLVDGQFIMSISSDTDNDYIVEGSLDMQTWNPVGPARRTAWKRFQFSAATKLVGAMYFRIVPGEQNDRP